MSDRAILARATPGNGWEGRYIHNSGSPYAVGPWLAQQGDPMALRALIDEHPAGWSDLTTGECYCHDGDDVEPESLWTHEDEERDNAAFHNPWVYVLRPDGIQVLGAHPLGVKRTFGDDIEQPACGYHHVVLVPWELAEVFPWSTLMRPMPEPEGAVVLANPPAGHVPMTPDELLRFQELADRCRNYSGALDDRVRLRLYAAVEVPCSVTWNDAYSLVVSTSRPSLTLWQAVLAVDPSFPQRGPIDGEWPIVPTRAVLIAALEHATT